MENREKRSGAQTFAIWFGLAALMFGTQVGGSMAAGTYAVGYFAPFGGGWLLVLTAIYFCFRSAFAIHALEFTRLFKTDNYSAYYLELYGLNGDRANPVLKKAVMWVFDIYTTVAGVVVVAATINLFGSLTSSIGINPYLGRLIAVGLFAFLSIYGAAFLRKFNTAMTISLVVSMLVIFGAVLSVRGDVFLERIGNFAIGADWTGKTHRIADQTAGFLWTCESYDRLYALQFFRADQKHEGLGRKRSADRTAFHFSLFHYLLHCSSVPAGDDQ